jgi:hypothetical protein
MYKFSFFNLSLVGGEWWVSRSGRFTPRGENLRYPLVGRGGPHSRSGRSYQDWKSDPCVVHSVASRNTDRATAAPILRMAVVMINV